MSGVAGEGAEAKLGRLATVSKPDPVSVTVSKPDPVSVSKPTPFMDRRNM